MECNFIIKAGQSLCPSGSDASSIKIDFSILLQFSPPWLQPCPSDKLLRKNFGVKLPKNNTNGLKIPSILDTKDCNFGYFLISIYTQVLLLREEKGFLPRKSFPLLKSFSSAKFIPPSSEKNSFSHAPKSIPGKIPSTLVTGRFVTQKLSLGLWE